MDKIKYFTLQRKVVGYKTTESWTTIPHVTFIYEADATNLLNNFDMLRTEKQDKKITLNTLLLRICVEAIKAAPQVNAVINYNSKYVTGKVEIINDISISIPWALENGEIISVNLRNFESKTLMEMQEYINKTALKIKNCDVNIPLYQVSVNNMLGELRKGHLLKAVKALLGAAFGKSKIAKYSKKDIETYNKIPVENKITTQDLVPGTITISNLGSVYKDLKGFMGLLEIIPPQVFAIGIGSVQEKAGIINNGKNEKVIAIRKIIPMCLAFDHRALNFNEIVPFIQKLDSIFEHVNLLKEWY